MDSLLPKELLLLSQALVIHGSAQLDAVSRAVLSHPALASTSQARQSMFSPQACLQILQEMLAAEGLDASRLPELKRPNSRINLKLARKYYMARLAELRNKLSSQEELMRLILKEEEEINNGAWDDKLTQDYELVHPPPEGQDSTLAVYRHHYAAPEQAPPAQLPLDSTATTTATTASVQAAQQDILPEYTNTETQQDLPQPKEEAASPAKELHFSDVVDVDIAAEEHSNEEQGQEDAEDDDGEVTDGGHRSGREGTAVSTLPDVPEEDEEDTSREVERQQEEDKDTGNDGANTAQMKEEEAADAKPTQRTTRRTSIPPSSTTKTASSSSSTTKPTISERRSSSRVSRSITNLSEVATPPSTSAPLPTSARDPLSGNTASPVTLPLANDTTQEDDSSPKLKEKEKEVIQPSSEGMIMDLDDDDDDLEISSTPMEAEGSKDSNTVAAATSSTTTAPATAVPAKRGRSARKSSVPPVVAKDVNKRKRTTTPQAQATSTSDKQSNTTTNQASKASSPGPSERARSKRIKTEEPESGLGTPVESDRTPGGSASDANAIRRFRNAAPHLINQMVSSVYSTYFKEPVRQGEAMNYFEIIKKPMDLKTLLSNVKNGKITNSIEFTRDLALIFANAIMYNGADHHVARDARAMWREAQDLLRVLEAAEQRAM